jgi:hypothetical protein
MSGVRVFEVAEEMHRRLEEERKRRFLHSIPETIRLILSEYLSNLHAEKKRDTANPVSYSSSSRAVTSRSFLTVARQK